MLQTKLAAELGVTKGRVSQLKKRGMPVHDTAAARAWIAQHGKEGRGHKGKSPSVTASVRAAVERPVKPRIDTTATDTDDPAGVLARMRETEMTAYKLITEALAKAARSRADEDYSVLPGLVRSYNQSAANALDAQARWERHCRNSGQVAPVEHLVNVLHARLEPLAAELRNLPRNVAAAANPTSPQIAENAVSAALESILRQIAAGLVPIPPADTKSS